MGIIQKLREMMIGTNEAATEEKASDVLIKSIKKKVSDKRTIYYDPTPPTVDRLRYLIAHIERSYKFVGGWYFGQLEDIGTSKPCSMSKVEADECARVLTAKGYDVRKVNTTMGGYKIY